MSLRLGSLVLYPDVAILPFALAFFIVLASRRLNDIYTSRRAVWLVLGVTIVSGVAGAYALGIAALPDGSEVAQGLHARFQLRFASFGGYWAVLLSGCTLALFLGQSPLATAGALSPGICGGGAVARAGCLFAGCCRGIRLPGDGVFGCQIFAPWAAYDGAALLVTLGAGMLLQKRAGMPHPFLVSFLVLYGALRFGLEFLRDTHHVTGPFTLTHFLAAAQIAAGLLLIVQIRRVPQQA